MSSDEVAPVQKKRRLKLTNRTTVLAIITVLSWSSLIMLLQHSQTGSFINHRIATVLDFRVRDYLGKNPPISPKIKIFGFDDKTFSVMQRPELYIDEWALCIKRLSEYQPKIIIIDKLFSVLYDPHESYQKTITTIKQAGVPVVVGSFVSANKIAFRDPLDYHQTLYHIPSAEKQGIRLEKSNLNLQNKPGEQFYPEDKLWWGSGDPYRYFSDFREQHAYGPAPLLRNAFTWVGHLQYAGNIHISPFIRIDNDYWIPHASLLAADSYSVQEGSAFVNNQKLFLNDHGEIMVNLSPVSAYYKKIRRISLLLDPPRESRPLAEKGDVILLLPDMYTGGTDFHTTPFGYAPGGFFLASMINSVLTGNWLKSMGSGSLWMLLAATLGAISGATGGALLFWLYLTLGSIMIFLSGIIAFSSFGVIVPWLWILLSYFGSGILIFAEESRYTEKRAKKLQLVEAERKLLAKELREASVMAEAYKPDPLPSWPYFLIGKYHCPIYAATGDWYAFAEAKSGKFFHLIMCDITGHGVQAALVVSACKNLLENIRTMQPALFEKRDFLIDYMKSLNNLLWKQGHGQHVTTLSGVTFEPDQNTLHHVSAGHPPPLFRSDEHWSTSVRPLLSRHNPLGICEDYDPKLKSDSFQVGDELIVSTDGIPLHGLRNVLKTFPPRSLLNIADGPEKLCAQVWDRETRKTGRKPNDDVSLIWIRKTI
ncbi:MAG: SpoIIE family protein phosphatase [Deltaproteobacteria bacterium]|nr:SpoIIE family protein phosphatase [Deltaproteobacteria bacterium]